MRRKWMFSITMLFLVASMAMGQMPGRGPQHGNDGPPKHGMFMFLDLTEKQQDKIAELRLDHLKKIESIKADLHKLDAEFDLLLITDTFDESKIKSKISEINAVRAKIQLEKARHLSKVRNLLNEKQQVKFDQFILAKDGPGRKGPGMMGGRGMRCRMMPK